MVQVRTNEGKKGAKKKKKTYRLLLLLLLAHFKCLNGLSFFLSSTAVHDSTSPLERAAAAKLTPLVKILEEAYAKEAGDRAPLPSNSLRVRSTQETHS